MDTASGTSAVGSANHPAARGETRDAERPTRLEETRRRDRCACAGRANPPERQRESGHPSAPDCALSPTRRTVGKRSLLRDPRAPSVTISGDETPVRAQEGRQSAGSANNAKSFAPFRVERRPSPRQNPGARRHDAIARVARLARDVISGIASAHHLPRYARERAPLPRDASRILGRGDRARGAPRRASERRGRRRKRRPGPRVVRDGARREGRRGLEGPQAALPVSGLRRGLRAVARAVPRVQGVGILHDLHRRA